MSKPQDTIENLLSEITKNVFLLNVLQMEQGSLEDRKDEIVRRSLTVADQLEFVLSFTDKLVSHLKKSPKEPSKE